MRNKKQVNPSKHEYIFDFSDVDIATGSGTVQEINTTTGEKHEPHFDTMEKTEAFLQAYEEEENKYRAAHPGVYIVGDDDREILGFSDICHDFGFLVAEIDLPIIDALFSLALSQTKLNQDSQKFKAGIDKSHISLSSIKNKLNNSLSILSNLSYSPRRDKSRCSEKVHRATKYIITCIQSSETLYQGVKENIDKSNGITKEAFELLYSLYHKFPELTLVIDQCLICLEPLLNEKFPAITHQIFTDK